MSLCDMDMFRMVTDHEVINIKGAFDTQAECFDYWINFQTEDGIR